MPIPVEIRACTEILRYLEPEFATLRFAVELLILIVAVKFRITDCEPAYTNLGAEDSEVTPDDGTVAEILKLSEADWFTGVPEEFTSVKQSDTFGWLAAAPPNKTPGKDTLSLLGSTGKTLGAASEYAGSELAPRRVPAGSKSINSDDLAVETVMLSNSKPPFAAVNLTRLNPES